MASVEQVTVLHQQITNRETQFEAVKQQLAGYDLSFQEQAPWKQKVEAMLLEQKTQQYATTEGVEICTRKRTVR